MKCSSNFNNSVFFLSGKNVLHISNKSQNKSQSKSQNLLDGLQNSNCGIQAIQRLMDSVSMMMTKSRKLFLALSVNT